MQTDPRSKTRRMFLALLLACGLAVAAGAEMPDDVFVIPIGGENGIFDVGSWTSCDTVPGVATLCVSVDMVPVDGKGNYVGTAELEFTGDVDGLLTGPAKGRVSGGGAVLTTSFETEGPLDVLGFDVDATVKGKLRGRICNEANATSRACLGQPLGTYNGKGRARVKVVGPGGRASVPVKGFFTAMFAREEWTVTLDVAPIDEKRLAGTATAEVTTSGGAAPLGVGPLAETTVYQFDVAGKYNAKKDVSKLKAKPPKEDDQSRGAKLLLKNVVVDGGEIVGGELKFKVQGARGREDLGD